MAYNLDYQNRWSDNPDISLRLAKHNAEQAIEKNPKEPLARLVATWAAIFEKDLDRAKSEVDIALSLNPNFASAYASLGSICSYAGPPLEAIPMLVRATRLDPAFQRQHQLQVPSSINQAAALPFQKPDHQWVAVPSWFSRL